MTRKVVNTMKIKHKLILSFGLLIITLVAVVGINFTTYQTMASDANFVNNSGKLRATSYKMAQLANVIVNSENQEARDALKESMALFDHILTDVSQGNDELGLKPLTHKETIESLSAVNETWNSTFKESYNQILSSKDPDALGRINGQVASYVNQINDLVTAYSEYSSSKVAAAKITNGILMVIAIFVGAVAFSLLNSGIRTPILSLVEDLKALSEGHGDLTKRIEVKTKDEIGEMTAYFNQFIGNIHQIVSEIASIAQILSSNMNAISDTTEELTKSTEMIAGSSMEVAEGSVIQNHKLDDLNALVGHLKQDVENVSSKAVQTLKSSETAQVAVKNGDQQVKIQAAELNDFVNAIKSASGTVEDLNQSSEEIKAIVGLIHSISSQTNLLALNASIEAARAGEAGRGFAVVADEIRKLAEETSISAKQINDIVISISDKTFNVRHSMDSLVDQTKIQESSMATLQSELKQILSESELTYIEIQAIMGIAETVNSEFSVITSAAKEIQQVANQNSGNTQDVASAVQEQTASFEEVSASINSINTMADELTKIVGKFII